MRIAVDLPAPFSPTMAWIVPGSTFRLTRSLARTLPKRLVMFRSSIIGAGLYLSRSHGEGIPRGSVKARSGGAGRGVPRPEPRALPWAEPGRPLGPQAIGPRGWSGRKGRRPRLAEPRATPWGGRAVPQCLPPHHRDRLPARHRQTDA